MASRLQPGLADVEQAPRPGYSLNSVCVELNADVCIYHRSFGQPASGFFRTYVACMMQIIFGILNVRRICTVSNTQVVPDRSAPIQLC